MNGYPELRSRERMRPEDREAASARLSAEYRRGASIRQLCASTGYSIGRVRRLLIEAGVEFRRRGAATREAAELQRKT